MKYEQVEILDQKCIGTDIYDMTIRFESAARQAKPGQFVDLYSNHEQRLLPRPISICGFDREKGTIRLVYRAVGEGTREFSQMKAGEALRAIGPLGNGYNIREDKAIVIGGGLGVPPMLALAKELACEKTIVLGYRNELFLADEFYKIPESETLIATEDGSVGVKGTVIDALEESRVKGVVIYACGPMPMLRAIAEYAREHDMDAQISLEERMACGIGACLGCVVKTKSLGSHTNVNNQRVCKDGPVFDAKEVFFE